MKFRFLLLTLPILASCGKTLPGSAAQQRLFPRSLTVEAVQGSTLTAVQTVCQALQQKEGVLSQTIGTSLTFETTQTDCSGNVISNGDVTVSIQGSSGQYTFRKADGGDYVFPNVETTQSGIFAEICSNLFNLQSPLITSNGLNSEATYVSLSSSCPSSVGEICLEVVKANVQNTTVIPHTSDIIRIRTHSSAGKIGFFTYRNRVTRSFCGQNEAMTFTALMK